MDRYQTRHISQLFDISHQTVKDWCDNFTEYLSPTAMPGKGRTRHFTEDDLRVFSQVADIKRSGGTFEDVHIALKAGQRGTLPDDLDKAMLLPQNVSLTRMRNALADAHQEAQTMRDEMLKVQGENRLLKDQLEQREKEVRQLYRDMARLEASQDDSE